MRVPFFGSARFQRAVRGILQRTFGRMPNATSKMRALLGCLGGRGLLNRFFFGLTDDRRDGLKCFTLAQVD